MENLDKVKAQKIALAAKLGDALKSDDETVFQKAFTEFAEHIQDSVMREARGLQAATDTTILASRGNQILTGTEMHYYENLGKALRSPDPKMALQNMDVVMPETVFDRVFEDLTVAHPLLQAIHFTNTTAVSEWIFNAHETQLAVWGDLCSDIVKEITSGFRKLDLALYKLSAFIPVCNAMLDLGPVWLDRYVRTILAEALALGLEEAVINGTGNKQPIGMNRSVADDVVITGGVYPERTLVTLDSFEPADYGAFIADHLAVTANGNPRVINEILLVCNHQDYLRTIMPATTVRTPDGHYVNNVFPFPTKVVQSTRVPAGKAIFGIADRYFMGVGMSDKGKLEYSDEYRFLEDERVYRIKLYANGRPMDDVSFAWCDISNITPLIQKVWVENVSNPAQT